MRRRRTRRASLDVGTRAVTATVSVRGGEPNGRRWFIDAEGRHWTVAEELIPRAEWTTADEESHRAGYGVGWLHFTSAAVRKQRRFFPLHWRTLSDAELETLCERALAISPRSTRT